MSRSSWVCPEMGGQSNTLSFWFWFKSYLFLKFTAIKMPRIFIKGLLPMGGSQPWCKPFAQITPLVIKIKCAIEPLLLGMFMCIRKYDTEPSCTFYFQTWLCCFLLKSHQSMYTTQQVFFPWLKILVMSMKETFSLQVLFETLAHSKRKQTS